MLLPGAAAETIDHIFGILVFFMRWHFHRICDFLWNYDEFAVFGIDGWSFGFGHHCLAHQHSLFQFWFAVIHQFLPPKLVVHFVNTSEFKHVCCTVRLRTSSWEWGPVAMTPPAGLESDLLYMWRNTVQTDGRTET